MQSAPIIAQGWDQFPQDGSSFSQLPDEEFLNLLQKQFDDNSSFELYGGPGINPQAIQPFVMPDFSSPSEDSPSPPSASASQSYGRSRQQSRRDSEEYQDDSLLNKRKASDDDMEEEPTSKTQHTNGHGRRASGGSNIGPTRRKSSAPAPEDGRLNKRKEQNRAAQRAFRERKEKHVKDLEDQVAALEAKNELASNENINLRDLLARLQDENMQLKQQAFTFSVSKTGTVSNTASAPSPPHITRQASSPQYFNHSQIQSQSPAPTSVASPSSSFLPSTFTPDMDWSQLTHFDPAVLSLLDDSPQLTATDSAMSMDFGFGNDDGQPFKMPFTTIAANPLFMSFADYESPAAPSPSNNTNNGQFQFDQMWSTPQLSHTDGSAVQNGLDQLFSGDLMGQQNAVDFGTLMRGSPSTLSPIQHAARPPGYQPQQYTPGSTSTSGTSSSSPSDTTSLSTSRTSISGSSPHTETKSSDECPKTRAEAKALFIQQGQSTFVKPTIGIDGRSESVGCKGSTFPSTEPNSNNVEVLTAFRHITSDPQYKNIDVNTLCAEFSQKARCDGRKVVVEPDSLKQITESLLSGKHN